MKARGRRPSAVIVSRCLEPVMKHLETDESTGAQAECCYCFEVFGTRDETRSTKL